MKTRMLKMVLSMICLAGMLGMVETVNAASVTYSATSGGHSASATFDLTGTTLTVTLENLGSVNAVQSDVLTALLFHLGTGTLTTTLESNSAILNGSTLVPSGFSVDPGQIGGNWQYKKPLSNPITLDPNVNAGISTSGFMPSAFGPDGNFGSDPTMLDGVAFGLIN